MRAEDRSAGQILAWSKAMVVPALRHAVESLPASMAHIAGYHLGWWDADGKSTAAGGGKSIRPALALLSAQAVGGVAEDGIPAAVAVELVHNFSLLHDDVIDGDDTRRHRPTAWRVFGVGNAILAGDALLALAIDVLVAARGSGLGELVRTLCATVEALIDGQYADVAFESRLDVDLSECIQMAERKTGALLSCACALGGLAAGGSPEQVGQLTRFGARLGLAFQVADDLQGIWGDPVVTGKPVYSDLRNRKKSLPVVVALASGTPAGYQLASWYGSDAASASTELDRVAALVDEAGGKAWSHEHLAQLLSESLCHLRSAHPRAPAAAELGTLARLVTGVAPSSDGAGATSDGATRDGATGAGDVPGPASTAGSDSASRESGLT
jgi:geranylgeranyl diphosphate synthase type I